MAQPAGDRWLLPRRAIGRYGDFFDKSFSQRPNMEIGSIRSYHAHVYFDPASRPEAELLRVAMERAFPDALYGRWHDRPVGPHPSCMFQVAFATDLFARIVPWLALNHGGLTIFLHPETGDELADHAQHAIWIGRQQTLKLEQFMNRR